MPLVTVWLPDGYDEAPDGDHYDFVSFVNHETHGIPALLSGRATTTVEAAEGEKILYVNTDIVPLMEVTK